VDIYRKLGEKVVEGEPLYRIHASFPADFAFATRAAEQASGFSIGEAETIVRPFVEF
jgi:thymidine phosphorylase